MNVNASIAKLNPIKNRGRQLKTVPIQRSLIGPPKHPISKRKDFTNSAYTSNSSHIQWKSQQRKNNINNNSTTVRTASTSRSRSSTEPEARIVLALSEGRGEAIGEVGIAAINIAHPSLILCQTSDSQSYINTLTKINILNPSEILVPLTFIESHSSNRLIEKVKEKFCNVKITGVPRVSFNKNNGLQYVRQLCVPSMNSILLILEHRYYALAAAAALLTYTETTLFIVYANESIKIEYQESEGSTIIDVATVDGLELVASATPSMEKRFSCLLDILNQCITKIGARTLRATILQPSCSVPDIEARLDCVTELMQHADMLAATQVSLTKLVNVDRLLSLAIVLPDQAQNCSERQLNYILILNTTLEQIGPLQAIFENSTQPFFIELRNTLSNPVFNDIKDLVRTLIHSDAWSAKGQYGIIQRCFAIKSGVNSLLDILRKSYSERLDDMREYVKTLGEKHNLALTLNNTHKKGYHILLTLNAHQKRTFKKNDLPAEFIQVERLPTCYTMKTQELINLSHRVQDMMLEILKMSNIMIFRLLIQIREHVGVFYKLCEDIAQLDMIQSLAKASGAIHYVRPQFSDYLEIEHGRHPLLDFLSTTEPIANCVFSSKEHNMNIITGPNGSGKSIFIRQIVLIQVMAQVGCYVPAHSATLRVSDRILAKVYLEDNVDCGASAFVLEMKEIQYFLNVLTDNSLIVIDELCRSTSVEEGTALAMAVCEKLMQKSAFLFFTTHFKFMTKLENLHYNVKTWQLETLTEVINDQMILQFTYNIIPGVTSLEHYGIFLAKTSWPEHIIKYAEDILKKLTKSQKKLPTCLNNENEATRLKYNLEAEFKILKIKKQLTQAIINEKMAEYQRNLENLGYQADHLCIQVQEKNNHINESNPIELNKTEDLLSQILNNQVNVENSANKQINSFKGFDFHDSDGEQIFEDVNNASLRSLSNQKTSFANLIRDSERLSQDYFNLNNISYNYSNERYNLQNFYPDNLIQQSELKMPEYSDDFNLNTNNALFQSAPNRNLFFQNSLNEKDFCNFSENSSEIFNSINNMEHSNLNIFKPEIILETTTNQLEINFRNVQNNKMTLRHITRQNSVTMFDTNKNSSFCNSSSNFSQQDLNKIMQCSSASSKEHLTAIKEPSFLSQENLSFAVKSNKTEDSVSIFSEPGCVNNLRPNNDNESVLSVYEQQFSLPLQQNVEMASTPLSNIFPDEPFLINDDFENQNNLNRSKSDGQSKSTTVKWGMEKTNNVLSPPTSIKEIDSVDLENISFIRSKRPAAQISKTSDTRSKFDNEQQVKSAFTNSDTIKWGVEKIHNKGETSSSEANDLDKSNSHQINSDFAALRLTNPNNFIKDRQKQTNTVTNANSKMSSSDTSSLSVTEHQFSLPLQRNMRKTSTPLRIVPKVQSQPVSFARKQMNVTHTDLSEQIYSKVEENFIRIKSVPTSNTQEKSVEILKPCEVNFNNINRISPKSKSDEQQTKSTLMRSDSTIKWGIQNIPRGNTDLQDSDFTKSANFNNQKQANDIKTINSKTNSTDTSSLSVNEHQFSLPLQQNIRRTSTPLKITPKIYSQPISLIRSTKHTSFNEQVNSREGFSIKSRTLKPRPKSTPTNSDSIKWKTGKNPNVLAMSSSPSSTETNQKSKLNSVASESVKPRTVEPQAKSTSINSDSIKWKTRKNENVMAIFSSSPSSTETNQKLNLNSVASESVKPRTVEPQAKSTSGNSNSIKWKTRKNENVLAISSSSPTSAETNQKLNLDSVAPESIKWTDKESSSKCIKILQNIKLITEEQNLYTLPKLNDQQSETSIEWSIGINNNNNNPVIHNNKEQLSDINSSHYNSAVEINEVLNDLQSCSEYFTDCEENWEALDEETNLKLRQANKFKNLEETSLPILQTSIIEGFDHKETLQNQSINSSKYSYQKRLEFKLYKNQASNIKDNNRTIEETKTNESSPLPAQIQYNSILNTNININQNEAEFDTYTPKQFQQTSNNHNNSQLMALNELSHLLEDEVELFEDFQLADHLTEKEEISQTELNKKYDHQDSSKQHLLLSKNIQKNTPDNQTKIIKNKESPNRKEEEKQGEIQCVQCQIIGSVHCQSIGSLEPLGDIHLELFTTQGSSENNSDEKTQSQNNRTEVVQDNKIDSISSPNCISKQDECYPNKNDHKYLESQFYKSEHTKISNLNISQSLLKNKKYFQLKNKDGEEKPNSSKLLSTSFAELFSDESIVGASQDQSRLGLPNKLSLTKQKSTKDVNINAPINDNQQKDRSTPANDKNDDTNSTQPSTKKRKLGFDDQPPSLDAETQSPYPFQVSPSLSDFEIPDTTTTAQKKTKWNPPFKNISNTSINTSTTKKKKTQKISKFKPSHLTKNQIVQEFSEQTKKMLESDDSAQYIQQLLNRPTVRQLQAAKHIMSIHKTSSGIVVVPTKQTKLKTRKKQFVTPLKHRPSECDVTLLSDKNFDKFEEFMSIKKKKDNEVNVRQDVVHQYKQVEIVRKNDNKQEVLVKISEENYLEKFGNTITKVQSTSDINKNNEVKEQTVGYYTQNKKRIDNLVNKYLNPDAIVATDDTSQKTSSSIFSQQTVVIN